MAKDLAALRVVPFTQERVPNLYPGGDLPWQMYHTVRNALVRTSRRYGPTGPMGIVKIKSDVENPYLRLVEEVDFWERGDPDPFYYIIDDQWNHELYCYVELYGDNPFNAGWLLSMTTTLQEFEGWGVGVNNIRDSYILIFADRLMVNGKLAKCRSAIEVVDLVSRLLKPGDKKWWQFWN